MCEKECLLRINKGKDSFSSIEFPGYINGVELVSDTHYESKTDPYKGTPDRWILDFLFNREEVSYYWCQF